MNQKYISALCCFTLFVGACVTPTLQRDDAGAESSNPLTVGTRTFLNEAPPALGQPNLYLPEQRVLDGEWTAPALFKSH